MLKQEQIKEIIVPRYKELAVDKIWSLIKETDDLMAYFPNYRDKQKPDRRFMFAILSTLRHEVLKDVVAGARKNRSIETEDKNENLIYIEESLLKEIINVMAHKSMLFVYK